MFLKKKKLKNTSKVTCLECDKTLKYDPSAKRITHCPYCKTKYPILNPEDIK